MMVEKKGAVLAAVGDLAIRSNIIASNVHAFFAVGFGSSLIISGVTGRDSTSPSYVFLQATPYWPVGMGAVFVVAGIVLSIANLHRLSAVRYWLASIGLFTMGLASTLYAALFVHGTFTSTATILGPQWIYGSLAVLALVRSWYSCRAARIVAQLGD